MSLPIVISVKFLETNFALVFLRLFTMVRFVMPLQCFLSLESLFTKITLKLINKLSCCIVYVYVRLQRMNIEIVLSMNRIKMALQYFPCWQNLFAKRTLEWRCRMSVINISMLLKRVFWLKSSWTNQAVQRSSSMCTLFMPLSCKFCSKNCITCKT